jgi:hypothetical protein
MNMPSKEFDPSRFGLTSQDLLPKDTETAAHARAERGRTIGDSVRPVTLAFNDPDLTEEICRRVLNGESSETGVFAKGGASEMGREGTSLDSTADGTGVDKSLDNSQADGTGADTALDSVSRASTLAYQTARAQPPKSFHTVSDLCEQAAEHLQAIKDNEGDMSSHLRSAAAACINGLAAHHFPDFEKKVDRRKQ